MTIKTATKEVASGSAKNSIEMREKRAQAIAAMNLVTREGDRFQVGTPGLRSRSRFYEVWRDENAKVCCNCLEFEEASATDPAFRCEHILAVKHSLLAKTTETAMKKPAPLKPVLPQAVKAVETQNANEERTEESKRSEHESDETEDETAENGRTAVRKAIEARKSLAQNSARKSDVSELADTTDKKEDTMKRENVKQTSFSEVEKRENNAQEIQSQPTISNVIPMPFAQTLNALRQNVDPQMVKQREGWRDRNGNVHMVDYVEWHTVADILDRVAPQWSHQIRDIKQIGDTVAVTAAITIDNVTREGIGTGSFESEMGIKKAEHDALKRAAVKFGIARELYRRESEVIEREGSGNNPNGGGFPANPVAKSLADLVTPKQLGMIRALGRESSVDTDQECETVMSCKTDELSKKAASAFIQHLQEIQGQNQQQAEQQQMQTNNYNGLRRVS